MENFKEEYDRLMALLLMTNGAMRDIIELQIQSLDADIRDYIASQDM